MRESEFFKGIAHVEVPWGERSIPVPVFYYDVMSVSAQFLAPLEAVRALLPSPRMHPLRITPWASVVDLSGFCYRDCDIGPYNEVSFSVPFCLDRPSPPFVGTLNKMPAVTSVYVRHLPVTTEIARAAGVEFAAYPKFVADITFEEQGEWLTCRLGHGGGQIFSLTCRTGPTTPAGRGRTEIYNVLEDRLLRCEMATSPCEQFASRDPADVRLELAEGHPMAQELRGLGIKRALGCQYVPHFQGVLTNVLESLPM
jgi:hypothetical protein